MKISHFFLILICLPLITWSQVDIEPMVPNYIDWEKDHALFKEKKVKEVKGYRIENDQKTLQLSIQFDTEGYITLEKDYYGSTIYKSGYEYGFKHRSKSWIQYDKYGTMFIGRKSICDEQGYEIEGLSGDALGQFSPQTKYQHYYNFQLKIDSTIGFGHGLNTKKYYTYDASGRTILIVEHTEKNPIWTWQYSYDDAGRLVDTYWCEGAVKDSVTVGMTHYEWDTQGNLIQQTGKGRG